jgi:eukaryotic-like serine/threonine-protein kinase
VSAPGSDLEPLVGRVLDGRYRLDALLGQGGMGAVFRGYHLAMERKVAIKVLRPHLLGDASAARRFAREAKGTFKVGSEHAVKVHDFAIARPEAPTPGATSPELAYMVMEYLDGRTVSAELSVDGAFSPGRAVHVARQVCDALAAAHRIGLVHRDIKPDNILLQVRGSDPDFAKVLDFGLAKLADNAAAGPFSRAAITQGDMVFGTPDYMSPEQAKGQPLDGRSDLYAVGVTMFEMITGRCPFVEANAMLLLARHVQATPPRLVDVVPELAEVASIEAVEDVIASCLAKSRDDRPQTADALAAALDGLARTLVSGRSVSTGVSRADRSAQSTMDLDAPAMAAVAAAAPRAGVPSVFLPSSVSEERARLRTRRATWIAVGAAMAAIAAVAIIAVAAGRSSAGEDAGSSAPKVATPAAAGSAAAAARDPDRGSDGAIPTNPPPTARRVTAPPPAPPRARTTAAPPPLARRTDSEADRHVAAATAARAAGNRLKQLAEADLALRKDPRNAEARFLLGDALVATGSIENGCQYLRAVKRMAKARAAAEAAHCPAD